MSDLDRAKDDINNTRLYMSLVFTAMLAIAAGISSLYNIDKINASFWIGVILFIICCAAFAWLAKRLHNKTEALKDL